MTKGWHSVATAYDRSFAQLCAGAVPALLGTLGSPTGAGRLLDAGCGTGIVAQAAFARGWTITAVDIEPDMTAFTAERLPEARVIPTDLGELPIEDAYFGAIAAHFSLNHADHPDRAVAELHRVAEPGAPIAATVWPWEPTAMNALWRAIMDETGTRPAEVRMPAGEPFERTEAGLAGLLQRGGFRDATARRIEWGFEIESDRLWVGVAAGLAVIGQAYVETDDAGRRRIEDAYRQRTAELAPDGTLRFPVTAILATAIA